MKRTLAIASLFLSTLLVGALAIPVFAAGKQGFGGRHGGDPASGWHAGPAFGGPGPGGPDGPGFGGPRPPFGPGGPGGPGGPLADAARIMFPFWEDADVVAAINLTDEQIAALKTSQDLAKEELDSTKGSIEDAGKAIHEEMQKDNPDLATVTTLTDNMTKAINEKTKVVLGHAVTVKTVLTAEQEEGLKDAVRDSIEKRRDSFGDLRSQIRETLQNGGTIDDVKALVEDADLGPPYDHIAKSLIERAEKRHGAPKAP